MLLCFAEASNSTSPTIYPPPRIRHILDPNSQAQSHLRTPLAYTNVTARSVRAALLAGGWLEAALPSVRTFSNVLNRQGYRLRRVEKSPVQKERLRPMRSSRM